MSGVGGVPRKLLWTRQERSSRRRAWTIGRRQGRGVTRIGVHVVVKQKWKKEKNDLKAEATAIRREAHARWRGFDDKHNKATATRPQPATTIAGGRCADAKLEISREQRRHRRDIRDSAQSHTIVASYSPWSSRTPKLSLRPLPLVCLLSTSCAYESPIRPAQTLVSVSCPLSSVCFHIDDYLPLLLALTLFARMLGFFWLYRSRLCRS